MVWALTASSSMPPFASHSPCSHLPPLPPPTPAEPQYQSYHLLLAEVSSFTARLPHAGYRPRLRPAAGEPARVWWRYAVKAVQQQLLARRLTWSQTIQVRLERRRMGYMPLLGGSPAGMPELQPAPLSPDAQQAPSSP